MDKRPGPKRPRLQVLRPTRRVETGKLQSALLSCVASAPEGLAPSLLIGRLAEALEVPEDALEERDIDAALGTLVVTGRIDERAGRLVAIAERSSATG